MADATSKRSTPPRRHRRRITSRRLPIRADARVKLVTAIARGRQRLSEIETGRDY
jgi:hypothetical protein